MEVLGKGKGGGGGTVSVASPTPKKGLSGVLPSIEEQAEWYKECEDILTPMIDAGTATPVDIEATFARRALEYYVGGTPRNTALGSNVCCHGAGVHVTTYKVYKMEGAGAYHPDEFNRRYGHYPRLFMVDHGRTTRVGEMRGDKNHSLGRAGGLTGWDSTRDMFGFAMASFEHNFEALLGAFSSRPSLPCTDAWTLPNLVYSEEIERRERRFNCEIVEPAYAIPPASYSYSFMLPTPSMVLLVGTKCDQEVNTKCEVWNSDKKT